MLFSQIGRCEDVHVAAKGAQPSARSRHPLVRLPLDAPQDHRRQSNTQPVALQAARRDSHPRALGHAQACGHLSEHRGRLPQRARAAPQAGALLARRLHMPQGRGRQRDVHRERRQVAGHLRRRQDRARHAQGRLILWRNKNLKHGFIRRFPSVCFVSC